MGSEAGIIQIGQHRVRHGNIYERDGIDALVGGRKADLFYSDPPWGDGNLKFWDTMNKKMNPDAQDYAFGFDVVQFLNVVLESAKSHANGFVVIEYGKRWSGRLIDLAAQKGLYFCSKVETLYKGGGKNLPLDVVVFHTEAPKAVDLSQAHHTIGYKTVQTIFAMLKPKDAGHSSIGMDLCCGMGYTAQACLDNGMIFIGNELNAKRLQKTIDRLRKAEGVK